MSKPVSTNSTNISNAASSRQADGANRTGGTHRTSGSNGASGPNDRPTPQRQNTSDILEYYNSADASVGYSVADLEQARTSQAQSHSHSTSSHHERPSTAPTAPIASTSPNNHVPQAPRPSSSSQRASEAAAKKASESPQNSIRVVTHTHTQTNTNTTPNVNKRRPSIPHSDAAAAADNRRIAIIERDQSPIPNSPARSPNSPLSLATGNSNSTSNAHGGPSAASSPSSGTHASPTILTRRGVDRTRLALVSPPEVAPTIQVVNNASPSASASFLLSKSSRSKFADKPSPALPPEALAAEGTSSSHPHGNASNSHSRGDKGDQRHGTSRQGHTRAASEATGTAHNPSSAKGVTKPVVSHQHTPSNSGSISPKTPHSPRDIGIVGTVQSMSRNKDLHKGFEKEQVAYISNHQGHQGRHAGHSRHRSAEYASSGSDYGEEPVFAMSGDFPISMNPHSPVFQTPRPDEGGSEQPNGQPTEQRNTVATRTAATTTSANSGRTGHEHKSRYGSAPATGHEHGSGSGKGGKHASSDIKQGHVHMASPMHMTMPPIPQRFGSTPLLTPAIGDSKPIDVKVAAPVVVDIHSDLADLWLAATPDRDMDKLNHINHVNHGKQFDRLGNIDHAGYAGIGGGSSLGSPLTALTSATSPTDSSSLPTDFSVPSSRKSSVASPYMRTSFEPLVEPATVPAPAPGPKSGAGTNVGVGVATIKGVEPTAGTVTGAGTGTGTRPAAMTIPIPPRRIDIGSLSPSISPVCPPRPHRQPSPAKGHQPSSVSSREGIAARSSSSISTVSIDEKDEDIDKVQVITNVKEKDRNEREKGSMNLPEPPPKDSQSKNSKNPKNSKASSEYPMDPKYTLMALSDSESGSEYSHDIHPKKDSRSLSTSAHSTQSKNGSIHIREGAFPAHSVFLNRIKTEVTVEPPEADMKTPTKRSTVAALFSMSDNGHGHGSDSGILVDASNVSIRTVDSSGIALKKSTSSSHNTTPHKLNKAPSQSELAGSKSSKATTDSVESTDENGVRKRSRSLRLPRKRSLTKGKKDGGPSPIEAKDTTPFDTRPESPTDSTHTHTTSHTQSHANGQAAEHRHDSHSHLGHGLPPSGRAGATTNTSQAPSAFKAKGPLATSGSLKTSKSQPLNKPKSSWPPAMSFTDVLAEPTPIARALGYAAKIAELATEDCGLGDWIEHVLNRTRPTIMTDDGPIPVGPVHTRFVSGSSAMSELTFPMRPDAYKVMDLTPGAVEISTTEVPSKLPYPSLALQQGKPGYRQPLSAVAPPKSLSAAVKSGSAGFFSSLGRKASMRTRGTQSATESREREPRPTRRLVSKRAPPERGTGNGNGSPPGGTPPQSSTPSLTPVTTVSALPSLPTLGAPSLPGGPRAPRAKRASTMMISAPRPIISAPISQAPLSAAPTGLAQTVQTALSSSQPAPSNQWNISPPASSGYTTEPPIASYSSDIGHTMQYQAPTMKLGEIPRRPEGPRPVSKLARTPSFPGPGSYRVSQAGNLRSTASFRPPPSSTMDHSGSGAARDLSPGSTTGSGRQAQAGRSSDEFTVQLDKLCDILPNAERDTLALYLNRANGMNMIAIGRYLEDERKGTVAKA